MTRKRRNIFNIDPHLCALVNWNIENNTKNEQTCSPDLLCVVWPSFFCTAFAYRWRDISSTMHLPHRRWHTRRYRIAQINLMQQCSSEIYRFGSIPLWVTTFLWIWTKQSEPSPDKIPYMGKKFSLLQDIVIARDIFDNLRSKKWTTQCPMRMWGCNIDINGRRLALRFLQIHRWKQKHLKI